MLTNFTTIARTLLLQSGAYSVLEESNPLLSLGTVIWGICAGLCVGLIVYYVRIRAIGAFVRALSGAQAFSADKAITLSDAGQANNILLRLSLRQGRPLRRLIALSNEDALTRRPAAGGKFSRVWRRIFSMAEAEERVSVDFESARFYLPEETRYRAQIRYDTRGVNLPMLIMGIAVLILAGAAATRIPELLSAFRGILSALGL